ncbi:MAG: YicC/YloC family endoribonuclease [Bacteroidota bacterium]
MLRSMTGFGRGTARAGTTEATVEVRSVNGRFAEVTLRSPRSLNAHEADLVTQVKDAIDRGNATVHVTLSQTDDASSTLRVDAPAARAAADLLRDLREAAGLDAPVTLADLLRYEVFTAAEETDEDNTDALAAVQSALTDALERLEAMRRDEGHALSEDLQQRANAIEVHLETVADRAPVRVDEARTRLAERLSELLDDDRLDRTRLETELAMMADKLDVTEECVRLRSHLVLFRAALEAEEPVGRRLNFLAQEFNREINTIGSKANDAEIAGLAVSMKEELEKIREQVQNVV